MAGQISLACAVRADEMGCSGTIPMQVWNILFTLVSIQLTSLHGSDFLTMDTQWYDRYATSVDQNPRTVRRSPMTMRSPDGNQSLFNREWIYGARSSIFSLAR
jgi:hypothetical protein